MDKKTKTNIIGIVVIIVLIIAIICYVYSATSLLYAVEDLRDTNDKLSQLIIERLGWE